MQFNNIKKPMILGLGSSSRSGRWGEGCLELIRDLYSLSDFQELQNYLKSESSQHLENFLNAGRRKGVSFKELYKELRMKGGTKGLCNSETILSAALWSAQEEGCRINYLSLSEFFSPSGKTSNLDKLKCALLETDGLIISTPVYFGDHSSLVSELIRMIKSDPGISEGIKNKVYAGLAVGAKRNGGQETTLIYQIVDMINLGMIAVGNDSNTTAQYGGTSHAGDVGTAWKDEYGIWTSMGTGRRVAKTVKLLAYSEKRQLKSKLKVGFWITQDLDNFASQQLEKLLETSEKLSISSRVFNVSKGYVRRCMACDICPKEIDEDSKYRCIINDPDDFLRENHQAIIDVDAVVPVAFIPKNDKEIVSRYQVFNERLRYLRRGDYILSDFGLAPLLFEEIGSNDSMRMRIITSMIRHHTVMLSPMIGHVQEGRLLNFEDIEHNWREFIGMSKKLTIGRLARVLNEEVDSAYNPVGYVLSSKKDEEDMMLDKRQEFCNLRKQKRKEEALIRLY